MDKSFVREVSVPVWSDISVPRRDLTVVEV